jgi:ATP-dependent Clp protease ATP-binding subunit ClpA
MLEPDKDLENVFEGAVVLAVSHKHEYLTLEHFLSSLLENKKIEDLLTNFGAEVPSLKTDISTFLNTELSSITNLPADEKPKKTSAIDRMLNRAFTQVLFSGRNKIEPIDCLISIFNEKKSHALYFMRKAKIEKEKSKFFS